MLGAATDREVRRVCEVQVVTRSSRPDLADEAAVAFREGWPEFAFHDRGAHEHLARVERYFAAYDVLLLDADGAVIAGSWGVPFRWDGTAAGLPDGYDGVLRAAVEGYEERVPPNALSIMAAAAGLGGVVTPVRPTWKPRYPVTAMSDFARWARADGQHLDPWVRTHERLGARILGPAPRSMVVTGSVGEWEDWTGMAFPQTGRYVVPGALDLVEIDREHDRGTYEETNLWMEHVPISSARDEVRASRPARTPGTRRCSRTR